MPEAGYDERLQGAVESALADRMRASSFDIRVNVRDGVVQLYGFVDVLAEKDRAEEIIRTLPGVKRVENSLTVAMDGGVTDDQITGEIEKRLAEFPDNVLKRVQVNTRDGVVLLQGEVHSLAEKHACIRAAQGVAGAKDVRAQMRVGGRPVDDAGITNAVELALSRDPRVDARQVNTSTRKGVVTLTGRVDSPEAITAAVRTAATVPGVRSIDNQLVPLHGSKDPDISRTNLLRRHLDEDPRVSPAQVRAFVIGDTAYLGGEVYNIEAKEAAEQVARKIDGVRAVSNDIFVAEH
ncbi:hypothetical protein SY88_09370 [Clostridiales bacterium PH28_bin88]|nr:hypothetical protein SY88_09370 [Clostridiales bacterium PH28_bin88]